MSGSHIDILRELLLPGAEALLDRLRDCLVDSTQVNSGHIIHPNNTLFPGRTFSGLGNTSTRSRPLYTVSPQQKAEAKLVQEQMERHIKTLTEMAKLVHERTKNEKALVIAQRLACRDYHEDNHTSTVSGNKEVDMLMKASSKQGKQGSNDSSFLSDLDEESDGEDELKELGDYYSSFLSGGTLDANNTAAGNSNTSNDLEVCSPYSTTATNNSETSNNSTDNDASVLAELQISTPMKNLPITKSDGSSLPPLHSAGVTPQRGATASSFFGSLLSSVSVSSTPSAAVTPAHHSHNNSIDYSNIPPPYPNQRQNSTSTNNSITLLPSLSASSTGSVGGVTGTIRFGPDDIIPLSKEPLEGDGDAFIRRFTATQVSLFHYFYLLYLIMFLIVAAVYRAIQ